MSNEIEASRRPQHHESFTRVRTDIMKHGWHCIGVIPTEADPHVPFNYTIGLTETGLPELIIFGIPSKRAHQILRSAVEDIEQHGAITDGLASREVMKTFPC